MKKTKYLVAALCALVACLLVAGCGKGISSEAAESLSGKWEINSIESEDDAQKTSAADISLMKQMGLSVTLDLNEDGTASMDVFGEVTEGKWKAKEASSATLTIDGQKISIELDENGMLRLSQKGAILVFQRPTADSPKITDGSEAEKTKKEADSKAKEEAAKKSDDESSDDADSSGSASGEQQVTEDQVSGDYYEEYTYDQTYVDDSYSNDSGTATTA